MPRPTAQWEYVSPRPSLCPSSIAWILPEKVRADPKATVPNFCLSTTEIRAYAEAGTRMKSTEPFFVGKSREIFAIAALLRIQKSFLYANFVRRVWHVCIFSAYPHSHSRRAGREQILLPECHGLVCSACGSSASAPLHTVGYLSLGGSKQDRETMKLHNTCHLLSSRHVRDKGPRSRPSPPQQSVTGTQSKTIDLMLSSFLEVALSYVLLTLWSSVAKICPLTGPSCDALWFTQFFVFCFVLPGFTVALQTSRASNLSALKYTATTKCFRDKDIALNSLFTCHRKRYARIWGNLSFLLALAQFSICAAPNYALLMWI